MLLIGLMADLAVTLGLAAAAALPGATFEALELFAGADAVLAAERSPLATPPPATGTWAAAGLGAIDRADQALYYLLAWIRPFSRLTTIPPAKKRHFSKQNNSRA